MKNVFLLILSLFLLFSLGACRKKDSLRKSENQIVIGKRIHDFRLTHLTGSRFYLNEQQQDSIVLLFWATWCRTCKSLMVSLKELIQKEYSRKRNNSAIFCICTDPENKEDMKRIIQDLEIPFPILMDPDGAVSKSLGIENLPMTLILDKQKRLYATESGYTQGSALRILKHVTKLQAPASGNQL